MHVKKGDEVLVISGKEKGKKGTIKLSIPAESRVVVEGLNKVKRHTKPRAGQAGGVVEKENPIHASNVALVDPKESKPTRVGFKVIDGRKVRFARRSGEIIDR